MTDKYQFFDNVIGFSIGSINTEKDLEDYHPPTCASSLIHVTKNIVDKDQNILTVIDGSEEYVNWAVAKGAWKGAKDIFNLLKLKSDSSSASPVTRVFQSGIITNKGRFILESYEIERFASSPTGDEMLKTCKKKVFGPVYIDTLTWLEVESTKDKIKELSKKIKIKNKFNELININPHIKNIIPEVDDSDLTNFKVQIDKKNNQEMLIEKKLNGYYLLKEKIEELKSTDQKLALLKALNDIGDIITYESRKYRIIKRFKTKWYWVPIPK